MEHLTQRDFRKLLDFLREAYAPRDLDAFAFHLISSLGKLVPTMLVGYADINVRKKRSLNLFHPAGIATPETEAGWHSHMHEHPVLTYQLRKRDGRAKKISDFLSEREFRRSGLYNEVYKKMGVGDNLSFFLFSRPPRVVGIGIHRERMNFTERERALVNLAIPHLAQAWSNARALAVLQHQLRFLSDEFESINYGVVVLGRSGKVRLMTPRARQTIQECFGNTPHLDSRLPQELASWIEHELGLDGEDSIAKPRTPLILDREGGFVLIHLVANSSETLLLLEERKRNLNPTDLRKLGLTRREAEVLAWVAGGKTNLEIASILGISGRTVQKHLEHIFEKLGVENRTAAAGQAFIQMDKWEKPWEA